MEVDPPVARRTNGFARPFHPFQVLAWVVFGTDVFVFVVFGLPLVGTGGTRIAVAIFYALSVIVLVVATYRATVTDPVDHHVMERTPPSLETEDLPYCGLCDTPVNPRSKHCRACGKCVDTFDHHCMWLNNCVGGRNYHSFFVTVVSVSVMIGIILGSCLYLLIDMFVHVDEFDARLGDIGYLESIPREFFAVLFAVLLLINGPLFVLDTQLVVLHIFLWSQNLTTYEYIMNKRSQEAECAAGHEHGESTGKPKGLHVRTLPHWLDWIFFSRCGRRRRKRQEAIAAGVPAEGDVQVGKHGHQAKETEVIGTTTSGLVAEASGEPITGASSAMGPSSARVVTGVPEVVPRQPSVASPDATVVARRAGADAGPAAFKPEPAPGVLHPGSVSDPKEDTGSRADVGTAAEHQPSQVPVADRLGCGCEKAGHMERVGGAKV